MADTNRDFWLARPQAHANSTAAWISDADLERIGQLEVSEILSLLPDVKGKDVLELGAGAGGELAKSAKSVVCVDFVAKFLEENRAKNVNTGNVLYHESDIRQLDGAETEKYDLIFSNGLLMYLSDAEIARLFETSLSLLRPGGHLFFHETCFHRPASSADAAGDVSADPATYRRPDQYNALYQSVAIPTADGTAFHTFEIEFSRPILAYVKLMSNSNQVCWLLHKTRVAEAECHGFKTFAEFLDRKQYSRNGILRYERIFGENFVSTGGLQTTEEFVKLLNLKEGEHVLDVGAGIGGGAFYMAKTYGVSVTGIDLSTNMTSIALEKADKINDHRIQFEVCDAMKRNFAPNSFDVVYSRDTILHITDKKKLFASFLKWLKPGGRLLISDYCARDGSWSEEFIAYIKQRGYVLLSVEAYGKLLEEVGFVNVRAEDRTDQFVDVLKVELARMDGIRDEFVKEFSKQDLDDLVTGWTDKVRRCGNGDQKWGLFRAEKAPEGSSS